MTSGGLPLPNVYVYTMTKLMSIVLALLTTATAVSAVTVCLPEKALLTWERVIERKFYTHEELTAVPAPPPAEPEPEDEVHPDEMVDTFDERWRGGLR